MSARKKSGKVSRAKIALEKRAERVRKNQLKAQPTGYDPANPSTWNRSGVIGVDVVVQGMLMALARVAVKRAAGWRRKMIEGIIAKVGEAGATMLISKTAGKIIAKEALNLITSIIEGARKVRASRAQGDEVKRLWLISTREMYLSAMPNTSRKAVLRKVHTRSRSE